MTLFAKLTQHLCDIVLATLRRRSEFDAVVATLYWRCHYSIHDMLCGECTMQRWANVTTTLRIWRRSIDVVKILWIMTLQFQRNNKVVNTVFIVHRESNLLSNVESDLEKRCNFDVATLMSLQIYWKVVYWLCDVVTLPQCCHNVVCLLGLSHF